MGFIYLADCGRVLAIPAVGILVSQPRVRDAEHALGTMCREGPTGNGVSGRSTELGMEG